ncbi:MAG: hypothetical protein WBA35_12895 [Litorimonas sp.]
MSEEVNVGDVSKLVDNIIACLKDDNKKDVGKRYPYLKRRCSAIIPLIESNNPTIYTVLPKIIQGLLDIEKGKSFKDVDKSIVDSIHEHL